MFLLRLEENRSRSG